MDCPSCGNSNPAGARFCSACGAGLVGDASRGGGERRPATPDHLAEQIRAARETLEGERKQVTVLFADVVGSMELAEHIDPEPWQEIMNGYFSIMCDGVHRFEGTVDKFTGDGIMAIFGAPIAHEDHAR